MADTCCHSTAAISWESPKIYSNDSLGDCGGSVDLSMFHCKCIQFDSKRTDHSTGDYAAAGSGNS